MNIYDLETGEDLGHTCEDFNATIVPGQTVDANVHLHDLEPDLAPGNYSFTAVIGAVGEQIAP